MKKSINLIQRTQALKVESAGTIATMISALNQYFGDKFTNYIKTKNEKFLNPTIKDLLKKDGSIIFLTRVDSDKETLIDLKILKNGKIF
jgi:hypothetical protein